MKLTSSLTALTLILAAALCTSAHAGVLSYQQGAAGGAGTAAGTMESKMGGNFPGAFVPAPAPVPLPAQILPPQFPPVGSPPAGSQIPVPAPLQGTALPEPQTLAMLAGGLALMGAVRRRRKAAGQR